jgi:hypothetical protein
MLKKKNNKLIRRISNKIKSNYNHEIKQILEFQKKIKK